MATPRGRWRSKDGERRMSLAEHLRELRKRLLISAIAIVVAAVIALVPWGSIADWFDITLPFVSLAEFVRDGMRMPINQVAQTINATVNYTTIASSLDLLIQIGLTIAILVSSPIWLYQLFAFFVPGLTKRERKYTFGFFFSAVPLFLAGGFVGWTLFPHMVQLLASFVPADDALIIDAKYYYDFIIKLVLAIGIGFVLPVFLVLLNFAGVLQGKTILKGWRVAVLVITLFCAIATPAVDAISMILLAIPMIGLYFAAVLIAIVHDRLVAKRADGIDPLTTTPVAEL